MVNDSVYKIRFSCSGGHDRGPGLRRLRRRRRGAGAGTVGGFLQLQGVPGFGTTGALTTSTPFNLTNPSPTSLIGANDFAIAAMGDANFIRLQFSDNVLASSIRDGTFSGNDGVEIRNEFGQLIRFFIDSLGAIDPSNAFIDANTAPALVRLYIEEPTMIGTGTPAAFPGGQYTVNLVTSQLFSGTGQPFCQQDTGGNCINTVEQVYTFTVGGDMIPLAPASNASIPLLNRGHPDRSGAQTLLQRLGRLPESGRHQSDDRIAQRYSIRFAHLDALPREQQPHGHDVGGREPDRDLRAAGAGQSAAPVRIRSLHAGPLPQSHGSPGSLRRPDDRRRVG